MAINDEAKLDHLSQNDKFNFGIKYEKPAQLEETESPMKIKVDSRKFNDIKLSTKNWQEG